MIYKICSRCGRRVPEGTTCECQLRRRAESNKHYDRYQRDRKSTDFYRSPEWQLTRQRVLRLDHNLDVYQYVVNGRVMVADTVHHIVPLKSDWNRRLDVNNLMSLHHDTHSMIEREYITQGERIMAQMLHKVLAEYRAQNAAGF